MIEEKYRVLTSVHVGTCITYSWTLDPHTHVRTCNIFCPCFEY